MSGKLKRRLTLLGLYSLEGLIFLFCFAFVIALIVIDIIYWDSSYDYPSIDFGLIISIIFNGIIPFFSQHVFKNRDKKIYGLNYNDFIRLDGCYATGFYRAVIIDIILFLGLVITYRFGFRLTCTLIKALIIVLLFNCFFEDYRILHDKKKKIDKTVMKIVDLARPSLYYYFGGNPHNDTERLIRNYILVPSKSSNHMMSVYQELDKRNFRKDDLIVSFLHMQIYYFRYCYENPSDVKFDNGRPMYDNIDLEEALQASLENINYLINKRPELVYENKYDCEYLIAQLICLIHKILEIYNLESRFDGPMNNLLKFLITISGKTNDKLKLEKAGIVSYIEYITLTYDSLWFVKYLTQYITTNQMNGTYTNYLLTHASIYIHSWYNSQNGASTSCMDYAKSYLPMWKNYIQNLLVNKELQWILNFLLFDIFSYSHVVWKSKVILVFFGPPKNIPLDEKGLVSWWIDWLSSGLCDIGNPNLEYHTINGKIKDTIIGVIEERKSSNTLNNVMSDYFAFYNLSISNSANGIDAFLDEFLKSIS